MKKLSMLIGATTLCLSSLTSNAGSYDSQGMPLFFLRGSFNNTDWTANDAYRFTRNGDTYTLQINNSNAIGDCEFKIAGDNWDIYNLGADVTVNSSMYVKGVTNGPNMKTSGLNDAIISFTYNPDNAQATITFIVDGKEIVEPEPGPEPNPGNYPDAYLRGNFDGDNWNNPLEKYHFKRNGDVYTLDITSANAIPAGTQFKIGGSNWDRVDFGGAQRDINIDYTQTLELLRGGENLSTSTGINSGSISFTYTEGAYALLVNFQVDGSVKPPVSGLSGTLPVLYINVYTDETHRAYNNEVISKDLDHKNYFDYAEYWLDVNDCKWLKDLGAKNVGSEEEPLALQIKARGNWTRKGFSKKPFKLKLDKKQSLLGLTKSKHFAILAHADDNKGYLRNFVGFNLGRRIGLPWTPDQQPVEVVINGNYRGLYFLTESIRVDEDRVNITELADNVSEGKLVSGGYIVELDNYDEADDAQIRMEEKSCARDHHYLDALRITFDTPEVYSDLQRRFITDQFTAMNNYVGANSNDLWKYIDLDDAARYYLVEEIVSHTESYHGSTYLFRDFGEGQKWHFSPLWDFGNAFNGSTDDYFYNCDPFGNTWIPSIRENDKFNNKVKETWLWFMQNEYAGIENDIDEYVSHLTAAARADYNRWNGQPVPDGGQSVADNRDMAGKASEVKSHLSSKTAWLKGKFGDYTSGTYAEPARDTTEAAELPEYARVSTGVGSVEITDVDNDATVEYYTLQGMRVVNPTPGEIYIVVKGDKAIKSLCR